MSDIVPHYLAEKRSASEHVSASVIIPTFNAAEYLRESLGSVCIETSLGVEIIVVDDGSTDETPELLETLVEADPRIRIFRFGTSMGPSAARNLGIRNARGKWVALLDADDKWLNGRLERLTAEAELRNLDIIADNQLLLDEGTGQIRGLAFPHDWMTTEKELALEDLINRDWPGRQRCRPLGNLKPVFRRSFLSASRITYDEKVYVAEDFLFYAELLLAGGRFGLSNIPGYVYRVRSGSASEAGTRTYQDIIGVNQKVLDACRNSFGDSDRLHQLASTLRLREQAVRYQKLAFALKNGEMPLAIDSFFTMNPFYALFRLTRAALIRSGLSRDVSVDI